MGALLRSKPQASAPGDEMIMPVCLHGWRKAVSLSAFLRAILSELFSVPGCQERTAPHKLPDYKYQLNENIGIALALAFKYFLARSESMALSGSPLCSFTNIGSSRQHEGSRLRGADNDFDNPIRGRNWWGVSTGRSEEKQSMAYLWTAP